MKISLPPTIYKLFSSAIIHRISQIILIASKPLNRVVRLTVDHIHVEEQVIKQYNEFNRSIYIAVVDFSKAFHSIIHSGIWHVLKKTNVKEAYLRIFKYLDSRGTSRIK